MVWIMFGVFLIEMPLALGTCNLGDANPKFDAKLMSLLFVPLLYLNFLFKKSPTVH